MSGKLELSYKSLLRGFTKLCESHGFEVYLNEVSVSSFKEYEYYLYSIMNDPYYIEFYESDYYFEVQLPYFESDEYATKYLSLLAILKNLYYPFYHENSPVAVNYNKLRASVNKSLTQYSVPFDLFVYELIGGIPSGFVHKLLNLNIKLFNEDVDAIFPSVKSIFPESFIESQGEWKFGLIAYMLMIWNK